MSIQSEITRITNNVQDTIDVIEQTGVSIPAGANSDNLPSLAQALANGKQDKLTGSQGQFVGFTADNVVGAVDAPAGLPSGGTPGQMLYQGESGPEWGDKPVMVVNVSGTTTLTADKTAKEIYEAILKGYIVYADVAATGDVHAEFQLRQALHIEDTYTIMFSAFDGDLISWLYVTTNSSGETVQNIPQELSLRASNVSFTPGTTGLTADNVQDAIEEVTEKIPTKPIYRTVTLPAAGWSSNTQTVTVQGVLADETAQLIQPMPAVASQNAYITAGVICSGQAANQLTFKCSTVPTDDISLYVVITEVRA